ncbi:MAG: M14 family zinc carboxypeptidase [Proteobacteria bacterium]|nr:M14 family zinc carboxypeptidase [Pseudomonadota bacterium]
MKTGTTFFTKTITVLVACVFMCSAYAQADSKYIYHDYNSMVEILKGLENEAKSKTPQVYSLQVIGYTAKQTPVYAVKFSHNPAIEQDDKPAVVIDSGIHGNEWLPVDSSINFIQYLFEAYYNSGHPDHAEVLELVNNFEIWIIPMLNPDGRIRDDVNGGDPGKFWTDTTYHDDDIAGWRMNVQEVPCAARPGGTTQGIDINRSFSNKFWDLSDCSSTSYNGGAPFAALESRVVKQFINNHMISFALHQHSNAQIIYSASGTTGLGDYISAEADALYDEGRPSPLLALRNALEMAEGAANIMQQEFDSAILHPYGSGVCNGNPWSGQYYLWLWDEINCTLATDNHSRRAIQSVFYEYPYTQTAGDDSPENNMYGFSEDGRIGQYQRGDGSNGFHPSSAETNQWIINKSVEINKFIIRQARYPFSPRYHKDMSRRPEAPAEDLALVGAKMTEKGEGLTGSFTTSETDGRDLLGAGTKRVTWKVQNNGTAARSISSTVSICNLTDDAACASPVSAAVKLESVAPEETRLCTYDYDFKPEKDYTVTVSTGENNAINNDVKRFVFTTISPSSSCPAALAAGNDAEKITLLRNFRDNVLRRTQTGREYVRLFYQHSPELFSLIAHDSGIRARAADTLNRLLPEIVSTRDGRTASIAPGLKAEIEKLCAVLSVKASPGLKQSIKKLLHDLAENKIAHQLAAGAD